MAQRPYLPIVRMTLGVIVLAIVVGSFYLFWAAFLKPDTSPPAVPSASATPSATAGGTGLGAAIGIATADLRIDPLPRSPLLSVQEHRTMELRLQLVHA